ISPSRPEDIGARTRGMVGHGSRRSGRVGVLGGCLAALVPLSAAAAEDVGVSTPVQGSMLVMRQAAPENSPPESEGSPTAAEGPAATEVAAPTQPAAPETPPPDAAAPSDG